MFIYIPMHTYVYTYYMLFVWTKWESLVQKSVCSIIHALRWIYIFHVTVVAHLKARLLHTIAMETLLFLETDRKLFLF